MEIDDVARIFAETQEQIAALQTRISETLSGFEQQTFEGRSADGRAIVVVAPDGMVRRIELPGGLGNDSVPAGQRFNELTWGSSGSDLALTCRSMVEAINTARKSAVQTGIAVLREEFPQAFDLLTDLEPTRPATPS
ncbi:YbaB/EbfC family nucleoid-associated protein [Nocardia arthritidis]|uniref:YbaB/EbfC family DNA-binding protein n=1 Tax=Nocardia arthritidis TaxID=228602 RepID=A0A6G9Y7R3_9NOCA|nr:YbaB/EbfC family nucleoid-associated protein [Nocardia arthritidis]QIS09184.1 hypothetical protein F5544_06365 [Nocardia arthritidis]